MLIVKKCDLESDNDMKFIETSAMKLSKKLMNLLKLWLMKLLDLMKKLIIIKKNLKKKKKRKKEKIEEYKKLINEKEEELKQNKILIVDILKKN